MPPPWDFTQRGCNDLLHVLYSYFEIPELGNLRLLNHRSNQVASQYLFHTIILRPREYVLEKIMMISENELFAKGVRELIWETARYSRDPLSRQLNAINDKEGRDDCEPESNYPVDPSSGDIVATWVQQEKEATSEESLRKLTTALAKFKGLTHVSLCAWARRMQTLEKFWESQGYAQDEYDGQLGRLPIFANSQRGVPGQTEAFSFILRALGAARRSIKTFHVEPVLDDKVGAVLIARERAGVEDELNLHMLISLSRLSGIEPPEFMEPLQGLTQLKLRLVGNSSQLIAAVWPGNFAPFLSMLPKLEILKISLKQILQVEDEDEETLRYFRRLGRIPLHKFLATDHQFRRLRKIELRHFWLDASELCEFFAHHADTLEQIVLFHVMLGGTRDEDGAPPGQPSQTKLQKITTGSNGYGEDEDDGSDATDLSDSIPTPPVPSAPARDSPELPEWNQITQACRALPKLNGVDFRAAMEYAVVGKSTVSVYALEERAMKGRPNTLQTGSWKYMVGGRAD